MTKNRMVLVVYRLLVAAMVMCGALMTLDLAWGFADVTMALMTICNLVAIALLSRQAFLLLENYRRQKRNGVKDPVYRDGDIPELRGKSDCWK